MLPISINVKLFHLLLFWHYSDKKKTNTHTKLTWHPMAYNALHKPHTNCMGVELYGKLPSMLVYMKNSV